MRKIFIILLIVLPFSVFAQNYHDTVFSDSIRTVQLVRTDWDLSYPIINLNSDEQLVLSFDELSGSMRQYYYTIEHCSSDWNTSDITFTDYAEGYMEIPIYTFKYSVSTTFQYIHYTAMFPNDQLKINLSGNYVLKVYEDHDPTKVKIIKRFYVANKKSSIDINITRPVRGNMFNAGQQIDFKISHEIENIVDPSKELRVIISQNFRFDNAIVDMQPVYMQGANMDYTLQKGNIMPGGSEFRNFDIKSRKYNSQYVRSIEIHVPYFHFYLTTSQPRTFDKYTFDPDINGRYKIDVGEKGDPETDADYVFVHFTLPMDAPDPDGDFYVFGLLSDWQCRNDFKMIYNIETHSYELMVLLKQGYYNYEYVYKRRKSGLIDHSFMEGNHWETENDYYIFLYYRPFAGRYEQLIGVETANSLRKK